MANQLWWQYGKARRLDDKEARAPKKSLFQLFVIHHNLALVATSNRRFLCVQQAHD